LASVAIALGAEGVASSCLLQLWKVSIRQKAESHKPMLVGKLFFFMVMVEVVDMCCVISC
jgi:hypothetical protein